MEHFNNSISHMKVLITMNMHYICCVHGFFLSQTTTAGNHCGHRETWNYDCATKEIDYRV
jgi:hypothetical protein